jgi:phosphoribosyl-ATP pyrophosphohydrolase
MNIVRPEFTEKDIEKAVNRVLKRFHDKCDKKGYGIFISANEIVGKGTEEWSEIVDALHRKNNDDLSDELTDMAIVSLLGIISLIKLNEK